MPTFNEKFSKKRVLKYFFFMIFVLWFLSGLFITYKYLLSFSNEKESKGGTFVEGIFSDTSYLPYLRNDRQSKFYQGLLFHGCIGSKLNGEKIDFSDDMCHITTTDFKTYYISLLTGYSWFDTRPVTLDDIFFTYNDIIKNNTWNIPFLNGYKDLVVSQTLDNRVKIIFQNASVDNTIFFTNYILPKHIVVNMKYEDYKQNFGVEPIHNQCSIIGSNTKDQYSLVFDVSNCKNTYLGFYQLKSNESFDIFKNLLTQDGSIIDIYEDHGSVTGYISQNIKTNKLVTIFFNTNSPKLQVRQRRTLGGLIENNFFAKTGYENLMQKYDDKIFNYFVSDGENIKDFLGYKSSTSTGSTVSKVNLVGTDTKLLPGSITISGNNQKYAFYIETVKNTINLKLNFDQVYDKISISNNKNEYYPKTYNKKEKNTEYNISKKLGNLVDGLNKYEIYGYIGTEKVSIATIDLYNLQGGAVTTTITTPTKSTSSDKIIVVYYNNPLYNFVVERLKTIFSQNGVLDYFVFQPVSSIQELEGKLAADEYDIVINSIDMGLKKDISKLLATNKKEINHSQYTNPQLALYLQQYLNLKNDAKTQASLQDEINSIYGEHMPFVMLGNSVESINIKSSTYKKLFGYNQSLADKLYDFNRRQLVYENLVLANNANINISEAQKISNFVEYIKKNFK